MGSGKKGKDVRAHFSAPPFGWPRDAIDAALIGLFGTGHLRATLNGAALTRGQLDQVKIPRTDFRVESATIDTRQRLKLRKLFQITGIDCKPNEEATAAGRLLNRLQELADRAGGDAPLPKRPDTRHVSDLQALAGNEQLIAVLCQHDELASNFNDWAALGKLASERLPAFRCLVALRPACGGTGCLAGRATPNRLNHRGSTPAGRLGSGAGACG